MTPNRPLQPTSRTRAARLCLTAALAAVVLATGCTQSPTRADMRLTGIAADAQSTAAITGMAVAPANLISNNGGALISNNGGALISNNGGALVSPGTTRYGLLAAVSEAPLANALAYLTDPDEQFYKLRGKMITTTTDKKGRYRFAAGVPTDKPVIVNVILPENRRVVGFTVPGSGTTELDVSLATTYVTEFLRQEAKDAGQSMATYDLELLPELARRTAAALEAGELPVPDLGIGAIAQMNMAYSLAVGKNVQGLGDRWAELLGHRILAVTTVAGSGITDSGGVGKPALDAEFYRMKGVCKDKAGNIYLADEGNHRICKIDAATGIMSVVAGSGDRGFAGDGGAATEAQLNHPRAVVLDRFENLYIFDSQNVRVRKVEKATGLITTIAGNPEQRGEGFWENGHAGDGGPATEAKLFSPRGGAFDSKGNLYIVDGLKGTDFHTIRKVTPEGIISTIAGIPNTEGAFAGENAPADQARLNYTNQICITPDDQLYMADTYNNCIRKIDLATNIITTVAGIGGKRGEKPEPDGKKATQTTLNGPYGVAVDGKGQIYIAERGSHRILVVKKDGTMATIAGTGDMDGEGEGVRLSFSEPHDMWVEADGNVLMTDTRNSKLRRIWTRFGL